MIVPVRNIIIHGLLVALFLATAGWQMIEHQRARASARAALASRAQDTAAALSVVIRSQGRFGVAPQSRIVTALQELIDSTEMTSVALLNAANDVVAAAGAPIDVDMDALTAHRAHWRAHEATFLNLVALGPNTDTDSSGYSPILIDRPDDVRPDMPPPNMPDPPWEHLLTTAQRDVLTAFMNGRPLDADDVAQILAVFPEEMLTDARRESGMRLLEGRPLDHAVLADLTALLRRGPMPWHRGRGRRGPPDDFPRRPPWLGEAEYERLLEARGVHWFVMTMPTTSATMEVSRDIRLRLLASAIMLLACLAVAWAWRAFGRASDLQLRLVRAEDLAAHLRELNMAAAGLVHETRNPLNIIRGLAQVVSREPELPPAIREVTTKITEESDRVTERLNRFLDYSRPITPRYTSINIRDMIEKVTDILEGDCRDKALRFKIDAPPLHIEADEDMLRQTIFNLLLNAVQAAPNESVIEVNVLKRDASATFEVRDDGPGVPFEHRSEIFRPYFTTSPHGAGLGLALVRQFAQAHQWEAVYVPTDTGALFQVRGIRIASPGSAS